MREREGHYQRRGEGGGGVGEGEGGKKEMGGWEILLPFYLCHSFDREKTSFRSSHVFGAPLLPRQMLRGWAVARRGGPWRRQALPRWMRVSIYTIYIYI